jgi:hypothetical protein
MCRFDGLTFKVAVPQRFNADPDPHLQHFDYCISGSLARVFLYANFFPGIHFIFKAHFFT